MDLRRFSGLYHFLIEASGVHTAKGRKEGKKVFGSVCMCILKGLYCYSNIFLCCFFVFFLKFWLLLLNHHHIHMQLPPPQTTTTQCKLLEFKWSMCASW